MKNFALVLICLWSSISFAEIDIEKVSEKRGLRDTIELDLDYKGNLDRYPKLKYHAQKIELRVPDANITQKQIDALEYHNGITLERKGEESILWINTGLEQAINASKTSVKLSGKTMTLIYPWKESNDPKVTEFFRKQAKVNAKAASVTKEKKIVEEDPILTVVKESKANDQKLKELVAQFEKEKNVDQEILWASNSDKMISENVKITTPEKTIEKTTVQKTKSGNNDILIYVAKITGVLAGIICFFLLVVNVFRKKMMSTNKLGFLHNSKLVEVVNTTYIAPKKSLLLVRAHDQFLLLSNTEAGIQFITQIDDPIGLLKKGEKEVTGENFDGNLNTTNRAQDLENKVTLKNVNKIYESQAEKSSPAKSMSQKLKNKARSIKQIGQQV